MFSPSPAPRRGAAKASHNANSPPVKRRARPSASKPTSRFATPVATRAQDRPSPVRDDESQASGMDLDEDQGVSPRGLKGDTIFAKSEEVTTYFYSHLPVEVKQALRNTDFYRVAYTGDVDPLTGFAVVASRETCFVWKYLQALSGVPTCYIFVCPQSDIQDPMLTAFHALVPYSPSREPGLIISSATGQIRFWDGLGMGLAGGDNFSFLQLQLNQGETVTTLTRSDPQTYLVSTSLGRLFRLTLTATGGSHHLTQHPFGRIQSSLSLSRLLPSLWAAPALQPSTGYINAVALGADSRDASGRDVWTILDTKLQRWNMSIEGWEELILEEDISELVRAEIRNEFPSAPTSDSALDLELLDLQVEGSNNLVLLTSHAGQEDPSAMDLGTHPPRIYALLHLAYNVGAFTLQSIKRVPYQSTSSSGAPMHPRMQLILDGKLRAVQFGDAVALCAKDSDYNSRFELKSATDRTLGVGVINGESELLILTAATMMKACINMQQVEKFDKDTGRADLLKSIMVQAILYGSIAENPLHFSFPPDIDEEALMSGAEQLSKAILESDHELLRPNHDLHAQMTNRKERLSFLIKFINDNAVLTKMSQRSRQKLATDAEKLYAAHQLWLRQTELLRSEHNYNVLAEAVFAYMDEVGEGHHEDAVRAFFRLRVEDLGNLLPHVLKVVRQAEYQHSAKLADVVAQANQIGLTILQSALNYRDYNSRVYGIELPLIDPWSSTPAIIDIVSELFHISTKLVETPTADSQDRGRSEASTQLPELASILFACIRERLDWLQSPIAVDQEPSADRDRIDLEDRFQQLRPEALETLRRNTYAESAFGLAEEYRDFRSLASLCNKDTVYPPQDNPNAARIESYVEKFKEEFTLELYQWYVEHGELRTMFAQEYNGYLDAFFAEKSHPAISWINDVDKGRYGLASEGLLKEAAHASELVSKHLMLSIGKLSYIAQLHEQGAAVNQSVLDAYHDGLDFVSVHETLVEDLKSSLTSLRGKQSLEAQVEAITQNKASNMADRKALQHAFKSLVRQLLQGKALSPEDIADVISMKDNTDTVEDYATAILLLNRSENIPSARKLTAFRNVWRRIYIHDDWDSIRQTNSVTDAELNERFRNTALYVVLQATLNHKAPSEGFISAPSQATEVPDQAAIALRWPGISPDEVEEIEEDYKREARYLADLELDGMYESIRQLVEDGR